MIKSKHMRKGLLTLFILLVPLSQLFCQHLNGHDSLDRRRLNTVVVSASSIYAVSMTGLYFLWYKDYPQSSFHFINDNSEWLQIDKLGHLSTSYYISNYSYWSLRWAGLSEKQSTLYGALMGFSAMTVIEILDGFSKEWGASHGDLVANALGPSLFAAQQLLWHEQRIRLKVSYHPTPYAQYNMEQLGSNHIQRAIKDYNGHTFWLSANINSFLKQDSRFPKWINVAVGYGAKGLLGPISNPASVDGITLPQHTRQRQYYLSMDVAWNRIKTNSAFLRFTFKVLSFVKLPFPTLEYNKENQFVFHWFYF